MLSVFGGVVRAVIGCSPLQLFISVHGVKGLFNDLGVPAGEKLIV